MKKQDERWEGEAEDAEFGDTGIDIDVDSLFAEPKKEKTPMDVAVESSLNAVRGIVGDEDHDQYLVEVTTATNALARAHTIAETKQVMDAAVAAEIFAKRAGMSDEHLKMAIDLKALAMRKLGKILAVTEKAKGTRGQLHGKDSSGSAREEPPEDTTTTLADLGISKKLSSQAQKIANLNEELFEEVRKGELTISAAIRETKRDGVRSKLEDISTKEAKALEGVYDVVVIDPPWPVKKIERDVRPNQTEQLDYPTMTLDEIEAIKPPFADDCHVWLWTTHRFLPAALILFNRWGVKYVGTFVWHKPGGFQPIGLPQYNCEFAVYGRIGSPTFIDTKALPMCFNAGRGRHSEKPAEFYEMVARVTAGRRVEMYSRDARDGFDAWGNEAQ